VLAEHGGVAYHEDGSAEDVGPVARIRVRRTPKPLTVRMPPRR
jgi:hypothetical protein